MMKEEKRKKRYLKKRYKYLLVLFIIFSLLMLWARYISTSGLIVKEYRVINGDLPTHFHGLKIVHFTDLHYGSTINKKELNKLVNEINILRPDIVVFTGDLIDEDITLTNEMKKELVEELKKIKTVYGKYAISGNHDFYFSSYKNILNESNFIDLDNNYDIIYNNYYEAIFIGGIESEVDGKPDIEKVINYFKPKENEETNDIKYKILLMHTPDTFDKIKQYDFDLVLAGHSHNGQVRLPFIGKIITPERAKKYYEAYYKINNTDFFISGGLGTSILKFRFFNRPSFNFYRLTQK